jgi:hypothetical protein
VSKDLELRCFCGRQTLLAICGRDLSSGEPFIHIKAFKAGKIITEIVVTEGKVRVHCPNCLRWHSITIKRVGVEHKPEKLPESISI